jgi:LysM repeat protein
MATACGGGSSKAGPPDLSKIPTATLPATLPAPITLNGGVVQPGGGATYSVKNGDTLASIAERFGVSLDDLLAANPGVNPATLHNGDNIKLPAGTSATVTPRATSAVSPATAEPTSTRPPAPTNTPESLGQTYVVKSGDIPETIARDHGITVEALLAANPGVNPNNLQVGQVLVIPPAPTATPPA